MAAKHRKPRCFVAMAFDQTDTDAIYDKVIKPVLRRNGVNPIIINRRQDNRDINQQIMEQLDRADFCIADLTYTRPSVYFEAGYAQRQVEVIYTVRSDHLKKNQPEHLRVHFDLQMKPLIKWTSENDPTFSNRLESRLKQTVLRTWKAKTKQTESEKREKDVFIAMSTNDKLRRLRSISIRSLHKIGFCEWCMNCFGGPPSLRRKYELYQLPRQLSRVYKKPDHLSELHALFVARQKTKSCLLVSSVLVAESMTQTSIRDEIVSSLLRPWPRPTHFNVGYNDKDRAKITTSEEHHIVVSLNNIPRTRIMKIMPKLSFDLNKDRYSMTSVFSESGIFKTSSSKKIQRHLHFYFLTKISSESDLRAKLILATSQIREVMKSKS